MHTQPTLPPKAAPAASADQDTTRASRPGRTSGVTKAILLGVLALSKPTQANTQPQLSYVFRSEGTATFKVESPELRADLQDITRPFKGGYGKVTPDSNSDLWITTSEACKIIKDEFMFRSSEPLYVRGKTFVSDSKKGICLLTAEPSASESFPVYSVEKPTTEATIESPNSPRQIAWKPSLAQAEKFAIFSTIKTIAPGTPLIVQGKAIAVAISHEPPAQSGKKDTPENMAITVFSSIRDLSVKDFNTKKDCDTPLTIPTNIEGISYGKVGLLVKKDGTQTLQHKGEYGCADVATPSNTKPAVVEVGVDGPLSS